MNTKEVYQLDEEGYLVGKAIAFESPLELGVYHIPRNCVDTTLQLPEIKHHDDLIKWTGKEWTICNERIEKENERLRKEQERLDELQKIEDEKERQIALEKEKRRQELIQKKIQLLEELITTKEKLNTLTYIEYQQLQSQISELKEQ